jgi:outer membrane protein OmpA-like peptidoglycan-associated protein
MSKRILSMASPARACALCAPLLMGFTTLTPAWAADAGKDCAPMGSLPGYVFIDSHEEHPYASETFHTDKGDVTVAGHFCKQDYAPGKGTQSMSELERQMNYRAQLDQLGATTVHTEDSETDAKLVKGDQEQWIKVHTWDDQIYITVLDKQPFKQTFIDTPSGIDYAPLGHMPNYAQDPDSKPKKENFDQDTFTIKDGDGSKDVQVQGGLYQASYLLKDGAPPYTHLEVMTNYVNALKKLGARIVYQADDDLDAQLDKNGQTVWLKINLWDNIIHLHVIEEKVFQATIKPPQASAMKTALDKDGHVALNINFDFDKATLRPDAAPIIAQVVALLKDNPDLKLSIEGNTDNVGDHDYNVKLSQQRAAAVVATLVKAGIAADRLTSAGNGPDKPVADNDTTEGRAKNRRVELVKT